MKLVTAIIQPFMLDKLARILRRQSVSGYTATDVRGSGSDLANTPDYVRPRVKVEIAVNDEHVSMLTEAIIQTVSTHQGGDGIILVSPLEDAINIQTGLRGVAALNASDL